MRISTLLFALLFGSGVQAQQLLPGYNSAQYGNITAAARGVAQPFLLRQGYGTLPGLAVADSTLTYSGTAYMVHQVYQNGGTSYLIPASQFSAYGMAQFAGIWPNGIPNITYNPTAKAWEATGDCVSYITRVLSVTGDTTVSGNAYLNLMYKIRTANNTLFAARGYVATAYQLGAAFPTLSATDTSGWQYICGNVLADSIDATNHAIKPSVGTYTGVAKGGFADARTGDVIAWSYPRSAAFNGHAMILDAAPQRLYADSLKVYAPNTSVAAISGLLSRFRVYAVPLLDCSGQKAHFRDSRQTVSGVGRGTVLLLTSLTTDIPQGFLFGTGSAGANKFYYDSLGVNVFAISVGRWKGGTSTTALQSVSEKRAGLRIYPNPSADILTVEDILVGSTIVVADVTGKICFSVSAGNSNRATLNVSTLPPGAYIVYSGTEPGGCTAKFIKE